MKKLLSSYQEIFEEVESLLLEELGIAKTAIFLKGMRRGEGDYLEIRKELFKDLDLETLKREIEKFKKHGSL